ncbi:uncharacterized protein DUF397 [Amycolatopsis cihanbeyliensis]|uniref:Uncharacterized protein DUF397 n=1 Tax=Amycolatopsis cihanbeyliensis TaxID=1128664 RepID=A0A542DGB6_AMYCI|nr:uncharacterized protein DUF397 [Amycolatopsis cihanbeyliensis]
MHTPEPGGTAWRTSSYSTNNGACVEVGWREPSTLVRDSKAPNSGMLTVPRAAWRAFLAAAAR